MAARPNAPFESRSLFTPNLLPEDERGLEPAPEPPKHRRRSIFSCALLVLALTIGSCSVLLARSNNNFFVGVKNGFIFRQLTHLFTGGADELHGESEDRINFLLIGIGGPGHDGPYLSDTMILASFQPSTNSAALMSIPRDLIVPDGPNNYIKVNHIYALSQKDGIEKAFERTKSLVGSAFGVPIHYMAVIDFQGFIEVVDEIGGVTVEVEKSFVDPEFPAGPNRYQTVSFEAGRQKMDGVNALQYARSRHGSNGEGSDFARSKRQQKILLATADKLGSFSTLLNPKRITSLFGLVNDYTKTDIEPWEVVKLIQMTKDVDPRTVTTTVLDDSPNGYLRSGISSIDGAYILQPRSGSFDELQLLAQTMITRSPVADETPNIVVQNGTTVPNLAGQISDALGSIGAKPVAVTNAARQNYLKTVVYDYTSGDKPKTRALLESRLGVTAQTNIPLELLAYTLARDLELKDENDAYLTLDFLVILGEDTLMQSTRELIRTLTADELNATTTTTTTDPLLTDDESDDL